MRVRVKICGISDVAGARAAAEAGVDAVGFVFAPSRRRVTPAEAMAAADSLPPSIARVAVFRHPTPSLLAEVTAALRPDWYQSDFADRDAVLRLARRRFLPVLRDDPSLDDDLRRLAVDPVRLPLVVFEGATSGVGRKPDWGLAARLARGRRLVLAGGLEPANVAEAIRLVRPWGVDVSTGAEDRAGRKDSRRIRDFVDAVRAAERALAVSVPAGGSR